MPAKIYSCAVHGMEAYPVEIEVDLLRGLPRFSVVGLPDAAIKESKERVRSAIVNSGCQFPQVRKIVNLAPADVRKCGPVFDLPIAVGLLVASGQAPERRAHKAAFIGELALNGRLRPITGALAAAMLAEKCEFEAIYLPVENAPEALLGTSIKVIPVKYLRDLVAHLRGEILLEPASPITAELNGVVTTANDFMLRGSLPALRAISIAASGGHHVIFSGSPGCGKTLIARQLPQLLPPLSHKEQIELTQIYSGARLLKERMITERPFRQVHHSATVTSLIGGGNPIKPGEVTLAHRGVLFLDELTEFPRATLECLRQPLEDRAVTIARAKGAERFPAQFTLVGAMNPCPCGFFGDPKKKCSCTSSERAKYRKKLSGPFLDRIDIMLSLQPKSFEELHNDRLTPASLFKKSIMTARALQQKRFKSSVRLNSDLSIRELKKFCALDHSSAQLLEITMNEQAMSARVYSRILKVTRTIADMEDNENIKERHLAEALQFKFG